MFSQFLPILTVPFLILQGPTVAIPAQDRILELESIGIQRVAARSGIPTRDLRVVNAAPAIYPHTQVEAFDFKLVNVRTQESFGTTLSSDGRELDSESLHTNEERARVARYGRLEEALAQRMEKLAPTESIDVLLWLRETRPFIHERPSPEEAQLLLETEEMRGLYLQGVAEARSSVVREIVSPVAARLSLLDPNVRQDLYAPVLHARLDADSIRQVGTWEEVDQVYLDQVNETYLAVSRATIMADVVHSVGINGAGVKLGQIEVGGGVSTLNPYLAGVTQDTMFSCVTGHSTAVAGILASTHGTQRGIAPGSTVYAAGSCGGSTFELLNRSTAAVTWGATALNNSWGARIGLVPGLRDRFYDNMVVNLDRTVVNAAGNEAGSCGAGDGMVGSPGLAYNVITVGNFDSRKTVAWYSTFNIFWFTFPLYDRMEGCSSFVDPKSIHNDREKPEVAAPGTSISSTRVAPIFSWVGGVGTGTSFAAPMVTGLAGLLIQRNGGLAAWPESLKAIVMATAHHNIEGNSRLSERDGVGAIVANRADQVASRAVGDWGGIAYTCGSPALYNAMIMPLVAGKKTRVVIAWDNNPNYASYEYRPGADLDLRVLAPNASIVDQSVSFDNTYEIVEFTPAVTGNYTLQINIYDCKYTPSFVGWAWTREM